MIRPENGPLLVPPETESISTTRPDPSKIITLSILIWPLLPDYSQALNIEFLKKHLEGNLKQYSLKPDILIFTGLGNSVNRYEEAKAFFEILWQTCNPDSTLPSESERLNYILIHGNTVVIATHHIVSFLDQKKNGYFKCATESSNPIDFGQNMMFGILLSEKLINLAVNVSYDGAKLDPCCLKERWSICLGRFTKNAINHAYDNSSVFVLAHNTYNGITPEFIESLLQAKAQSPKVSNYDLNPSKNRLARQFIHDHNLSSYTPFKSTHLLIRKKSTGKILAGYTQKVIPLTCPEPITDNSLPEYWSSIWSSYWGKVHNDYSPFYPTYIQLLIHRDAF